MFLSAYVPIYLMASAALLLLISEHLDLAEGILENGGKTGEQGAPPTNRPKKKMSIWNERRGRGRSGLGRGARISGGQDAAKNEFPWQVRVTIKADNIYDLASCGGAIYNEFHVITAAHCFDNTTPCDVKVYVGELSIDDTELQEQERYVQAIITHPNYNISTKENDIAFLTVKQKFIFTQFVYPALVAEEEYPNGNVIQAKVSGWGLVNNKNDSSAELDRLQTANVALVSTEDCQAKYTAAGEGDNFHITDKDICAGGSGVGFCNGDHGGPLTAKDGAHYYLIGIVSRNSYCGQDLPGIFTKVSKFRGWAINVAGTNCLSTYQGEKG